MPAAELTPTVVPPGQLAEHITADQAARLIADEACSMAIFGARSGIVLRNDNIRIDRVKGGFRIHYGCLAGLRAIEPRYR